MQQLKSSIVIRSGVIKQMHELSSQLNITSTASNGALWFLSGNSTEGADCLPCRSLPHMLPRMRIWDTACNSTDAARWAKHDLSQQWLQTGPPRVQTERLWPLGRQPFSTDLIHTRTQTHWTPTAGERSLIFVVTELHQSKVDAQILFCFTMKGAWVKNTFIDGPGSRSQR